MRSLSPTRLADSGLSASEREAARSGLTQAAIGITAPASNIPPKLRQERPPGKPTFATGNAVFGVQHAVA